MTPLISIAICTFNRAELLQNAIASLCDQTLPAERYEILVVNNASTDRTLEVIQLQRKINPSHVIRCVNEPRPGLAIARNLAIRIAQGKYIGYLDDDALANPDWIEKAMNLLESPSAPDCVGGPIIPFYTSDKPNWFKDDYETRSWGDEKRLLDSGESFSGSNMIFRKDILESVGEFGEDFGLQGTNLAVGEETFVFKKIWMLHPNPRLSYSPDLLVRHWVPEYKMRISYQIKRALVTGQAAFKMDVKPGVFSRLRAIVRGSGAFFLLSLKAVIQLPRFHRWQNWVVEACRPVLVKSGFVMASIGIKLDFGQN